MTENSLADACKRAVIHYLNNLHGQTPVIVVGVDPGATGAVAILIEGRAFVGDIPTIKVKKSGGGNKTEMNLPALLEAIRKLRPIPKEKIQVAVEQAQVQHHGHANTPMTAFRVGVHFGTWVGILAALGLSYARIAPQAWKRAMKLTGQDKEASRLLTLELFPGADIQLKKHVDRAEAILIAEYYRRKLNGGV